MQRQTELKISGGTDGEIKRWNEDYHSVANDDGFSELIG